MIEVILYTTGKFTARLRAYRWGHLSPVFAAIVLDVLLDKTADDLKDKVKFIK
jgi:hypothetical protein